MHTIRFRAMGSSVFIAHDCAVNHLEAAPAQCAAWEQALSRFLPQSGLNRLNRRAGQGWTRVSPALWAVLNTALAAAHATDGLVTPTILPALTAVGYDRDFAALAGAPPPQPALPPALGDWRAIRLNRANHAVQLPAGAAVDLGGSAKGWAADGFARRLARYGPALVDFGGDLAVSGPQRDGSPWIIGVADPHNADEPLDLLAIAAGGVATSGRDYRRWRQGDAERHHLIDPRTGLPATSDLLTVTIVAPDARTAEYAAKAVLILGSSAGLEWLAARPQLAALLVGADGAVIRTANLPRIP